MTKQKVALVLSSGGARGLAHIGVIEALEEANYEINAISGCSMGAVIGCFYAAGKLPQFKEWVLSLDKIDVFKLLDFTFSTQGFVKGEKVFKSLEDILPDTDFSSLSVPFSAIATDIDNRKEVVFRQGKIYHAMRASVAIPTVFKPAVIDGIRYIDGGVTNPIPLNHVKREENDLLVACNVNGIFEYKRDKKQPENNETYNSKIQEFLKKWHKLLPNESVPSKNKLGFFDIINESIDLMQDSLANLKLAQHQPDVLVEISREIAGTFEFYKASEIISAGRNATNKSLQRIGNLAGRC